MRRTSKTSRNVEVFFHHRYHHAASRGFKLRNTSAFHLLILTNTFASVIYPRQSG